MKARPAVFSAVCLALCGSGWADVMTAELRFDAGYTAWVTSGHTYLEAFSATSPSMGAGTYSYTHGGKVVVCEDRALAEFRLPALVEPLHQAQLRLFVFGAHGQGPSGDEATLPLAIHGYSGDGLPNRADAHLGSLIWGPTPVPHSVLGGYLAVDVTSFLGALYSVGSEYGGFVVRVDGIPGALTGLAFVTSETGYFEPPSLWIATGADSVPPVPEGNTVPDSAPFGALLSCSVVVLAWARGGRLDRVPRSSGA